jgi:hypothetical protein
MSVYTGHRLRAACFVEKEASFRREQLDGIVKRGPLPLDLGLLLRGGAQRFFYGAGQCAEGSADGGLAPRDLLGRGQRRAQLFDRHSAQRL